MERCDHRVSKAYYHIKRYIKQNGFDSYYLYGSIFIDRNMLIDPESLAARMSKPQYSLDSAKEVARDVQLSHSDYMPNNQLATLDGRTVGDIVSKLGLHVISGKLSEKSLASYQLKLNRQAKQVFRLHYKSIKQANSIQYGLGSDHFATVSTAEKELQKAISGRQKKVDAYIQMKNLLMESDNMYAEPLIKQLENNSGAYLEAERIHSNKQTLAKLTKQPDDALTVNYRLATPKDVEQTVSYPDDYTLETHARMDLEKVND